MCCFSNTNLYSWQTFFKQSEIITQDGDIFGILFCLRRSFSDNGYASRGRRVVSYVLGRQEASGLGLFWSTNM